MADAQHGPLPLFSSADRRACEREEEFLISRLRRLAEQARPAGRIGSVLEVGPGAGRITRHLLAICDRLTICDSSAENLRRLETLAADFSHRPAAEVSFHHLSIAELHRLPECGAFDAALAIRVLPLVDAWDQALWMLCDAVRLGGGVGFDLLRKRSWPGLVAGRLSTRRPGSLRPPGQMLAGAEIDAALRSLPLESVERFCWGYPRWACWDLEPLLGRLAPELAFGATFFGRRCSKGAA